MSAGKFSRPGRNPGSILARRPGFKTGVQILFYGLCGLFLVRWLIVNGATMRVAWQSLNWPAVVASFVLLCVGFLFLPLGMVLFIRAGQHKFGYLDSAQAYYGSQMAKYLPGGIWVFPSRLIIMQKQGVDFPLSVLALTFEMLALLAAALMVSIVTLGTTISRVWGLEFQILIIVGCAVVFAGFTLLPELFQKAQIFLGKIYSHTGMSTKLPQTLHLLKTVPAAVRFRIMLASVALYGVMWLLAGLSFFILAGSMPGGQITLQAAPYIIGVFTFAWLVGFIAVFSPGGIGVREGVMLLLLGPLMATPYPMVIALLSRILWSLAEVLFLSAATLISRVK